MKITENTKITEFSALEIHKSRKHKYQNLVRRKCVNYGNDFKLIQEIWD